MKKISLCNQFISYYFSFFWCKNSQKFR